MAEVVVKHRFNNPQPDDATPDTYTKPKHWNDSELFSGGGIDGDLVTWDPASSTKSAYRTLVGGSGVTVTVSASAITVARAAGELTGVGTVNRVARWTAGSVLGDSAIRDDGLTISVGAALDTTAAVNMGGTFVGASDAYGLRLAHTLSPAVGGDGYLFNTAAAAQINKAASGTHDTFATMILRPVVVGAGAAALTNTATLKLLGAPSGGVNNYALWSTGGSFRFDGTGPHSIGTTLPTRAGLHASLAASNAAFVALLGLSGTITATANNVVMAGLWPNVHLNTTFATGTFTGLIATEFLVEGSGMSKTGTGTIAAATTVKITDAPTIGTVNRALWVQGFTQVDAILAVSGADGVVNTTNIGIEFRGTVTPSLTAFNRSTGLSLPMIYDALSHEFSINGVQKAGFKISADTLFTVGGTHTGSTQTEMVRMESSLTGVVGTNIFGLIITPTFVEAASGTHGQLTGIYVAPSITNAGGVTTNVYGINIDTIVTGAVAPTTAAALRVTVPTGGATNLAILVDSGTSRFNGMLSFPTSQSAITGPAIGNSGDALQGVAGATAGFRINNANNTVELLTLTNSGSFSLSSAGPHSIGGALDLNAGFKITGSFTATGGAAQGAQGFFVNATTTANTGNGPVSTVWFGGSLIKTGGTHTVFSTLRIGEPVISGTGTITDVALLYLTGVPIGGTNNYAILVDSGSVRISGAGPHAIGGATDPSVQFWLKGTTGAGTAQGLYINSTLNPAGNATSDGLLVNPTINEFSTGTHPDFNSLRVIAPIIVAAGAALTNASTLKIDGAPTGATNNYALWVDDGVTRIDGGIGLGGITLPSTTNGPFISASSDIAMFTGGTSHSQWNNQTGAAELMRLTNVGVLKIGGTAVRATTEGTSHLDIFNGTAPVGTLTNGVSLYSSAGELFVIDAGGTATQLGPHDRDGYWWFNSKNTKTGKVLQIDMERMMKAINDRFGWDFVREFVEP